VQNKVHTLSLQRPHDFMNSPYEHLKGTPPSKRMHSMPKLTPAYSYAPRRSVVDCVRYTYANFMERRSMKTTA